jgi:multidrug/hemolysin transport system permease protein
MGVFFSLLSPLILFVLYTFFLGNLQVTSLQKAIPGATNSSVHYFVNSWLFAGIIMITTFSTALVALSVFVEDRASGRFKDFLVAPIKRWQMIIGYLISAFTISLIMSTIILVLSQVYIRLTGGSFMSPDNILKAYLAIILLCLTFSAIASFIVTYIGSSSAFSAFNTILGTAMGFLGGIYLNVGSLPKSVVSFIDVLPFAQAASLLRKPFTIQPIQQLAGQNARAARTIYDSYGVNLVIAGHTLSGTVIIGIFIVFIFVFISLGTLRIGKKIG